MNKIPDIRTKQIGIGLVELLIALVLALVLTMGIIEVFLASKQAYKTQDALSRVQENGRFAMEELSRNIRMAGFQGCGNMNTLTPNVVANGFPGGDFWSTNAVLGYEYDGSFDPAYVPTAPGAGTAPSPFSDTGVDTDVISMIRVDDCDAYLNGPMGSDVGDISIDAANACNIEVGDPLLITDCTTTDLFLVTGVTSGGSTQIAHGDTSNSTGRLSKPYGGDARIYKFVQVDYFIQQNNFGQLALFKRENGGTPRELVEGVEDIEVEYGEDTGTDFFVDEYRDATAVTDWAKVSSVRPRVSLRSKDANITLDNQPLRQDMTSTIGIRNRLP